MTLRVIHQNDRHVRVVLADVGNEAAQPVAVEVVAQENGRKSAVADAGTPVLRQGNPDLWHIHEFDQFLEILGAINRIVDDHEQERTRHRVSCRSSPSLTGASAACAGAALFRSLSLEANSFPPLRADRVDVPEDRFVFYVSIVTFSAAQLTWTKRSSVASIRQQYRKFQPEVSHYVALVHSFR